MDTNEVIALEEVLALAKTLVVDERSSLVQEQILLVEQWLWSNYCKDCKCEIQEGGICSCSVPF